MRTLGLFAAVAVWVAATLPTVIDVSVSAAPPRNLIVGPETLDVNVLDQNWTDDEASWFYDVSQGSQILPYKWFLVLEQPESDQLFRNADHMRELDYLPRTADTSSNPDGLPIGFVKTGDFLGVTCAACHTAQLNYQGKAWLIDGTQGGGDVEKLLRRLAEALDKTHADDEKFDRFAKAILGGGAPAAARTNLRDELAKVQAARHGYNERNFPKPGSPGFGPGRVDAFGAIMNEITATFAQLPTNHSAANAPVSYPCLWDAPQHDRVQWNGAAENNEIPLLRSIVGTAHVGALGRNIGEVLGVFGKVDATVEGSLLHLRGYPSSIEKDNLIDIEESLRKLWSPQWPAGLPAIDGASRAAGEAIFEANCQSCHAPIRRKSESRRVFAQMVAVGTDQTMASNFAARRAKSGVFEGRLHTIPGFRRLDEEEPVKNLLVHTVQRVLLRPSIDDPLPHLAPSDLLARLAPTADYRIFAEMKVGDRRLSGSFASLDIAEGKVRGALSRGALNLSEHGKAYQLDVTDDDATGRFVGADGDQIRLSDVEELRPTFLPGGTRLTFAVPTEISFAYKARPLNGIWATAPYLHNGSVPNLAELLKPAAERVKKFHLGSRELDPIAVGLRTAGPFEYDTSLPGNANVGHEYGTELSDTERRHLLEYLKSL